MNKILQHLKKVIVNINYFSGAKDAQIDFVSAMLKNDKFAEIPSDYAVFLKHSNGMVSGELEFFGTEKVHRDGYNYNFPNIVEANEIFKDTPNPLMLNCVLLGYNLLNAIIWDNNEKVYKIINRNFFTTIAKFNNFVDILQFIISRYEV